MTQTATFALPANRLRAYAMFDRGFGQEEVARQMGISSRTVLRWLNTDPDARLYYANTRPGPTHGLPGTYSAGCRCRLCREANRLAHVRFRLKHRGKPPVHGTESAYTNYKCRCDLCRAAGSRHNRRTRENRLASVVQR